MPKAGVVLSVYVSPADAALLRARASHGDRTISAEVRRILRPLHTASITSEGPAVTPSPRDTLGAGGADHAHPAE
jgi:hypothetical protein